jgi:putative flippase GtrA
MVCGALVNYGCYILLLLILPPSILAPLVGLAGGSLAGLAVNFTLARRLVFVD